VISPTLLEIEQFGFVGTVPPAFGFCWWPIYFGRNACMLNKTRNMFDVGPLVQRLYILQETPVTIWAMAMDSTLYTASCGFLSEVVWRDDKAFPKFRQEIHANWTWSRLCPDQNYPTQTTHTNNGKRVEYGEPHDGRISAGLAPTS